MNARTNRQPARRAFTLLELLVAIGILALLVSILVVAIAGAFRGGKRAATEQQLASIGFALEQFKNDFGYYPPLLNDDAEALRDGSEDRLTVVDSVDAQGVVDPEESYEARWHSIFSLPIYLVGIGDIAPAEFQEDNPARHDGAEGPGIRDPGPDKAWGGARQRTFTGAYLTHRPAAQGRTYGPYLDIANSRSIRVVEGRDFRRFAIDESRIDVWDEQQRDDLRRQEIFVLVDRNDNPIRYYRDWPTRAPIDPNNPQAPRKPSLERVPVELLSGEVLTNRDADNALKADADAAILRAPFALLASGDDGEFADADFVRDIDTSSNLMSDTFRNSEKIDAMTPSQREALARSLRDNVRYTP